MKNNVINEEKYEERVKKGKILTENESILFLREKI